MPHSQPLVALKPTLPHRYPPSIHTKTALTTRFETKRIVENHINTLPLTHTHLRPVQFMENFLPTAPFMFKVSRTVVMRYTFAHHPERMHQLVAVRDIGEAGARAFVDSKYENAVVRLAGWEGQPKDIDAVFREVSDTRNTQC